jgi:hypothetical protein
MSADTGTPLRFRFAGTKATPSPKVHKALRDWTGMRQFLNQRRKAAVPEDEQAIWRALFRLYGLPDDTDDWGWPRDLRYELLARRLAAELFPRCGALLKAPAGGPSEEYQAKKRSQKMRLFRKFERYRSNLTFKSRTRAAALFMKDEKVKKACEKAGLTKPRSFVQAMNELRSETPNR